MSKKRSRKEKNQKQAELKRVKVQIWLTVVLVIVGSVGWYVYRRSTLPGQKIEAQGQAHVSQDYPFKYNSSPPTSGPHAGEARWGEHSQEVPEVNQVHNLEHGGILIQYNCAHLLAGQPCGKLRSALRQIHKKAIEEIDRKIILAPYPKMPRLIAVTAWRRLKYFDEVDETEILNFAEAFIDEGPEYVP